MFAFESDARRVLDVLPKRFGKYGLTLHPDKTRLLDFRRPRRGNPARPMTFDFLGFTHYWGVSRNGKGLVKQQTAKDRFSRALRRVRTWCREHRYEPVRAQQQALSQKLRGHHGHFGVTSNCPALSRFYREVRGVWQKWLSRRSNAGYVEWDRMLALLKRFPLPLPRVARSYGRLDPATNQPTMRPMAPPMARVAARSVRDLPGPRGLPLLGSALAIGPTNAHAVFERWCHEHGDLFTFRIGGQRAVGVAVPELARDLMQARPDSFRRFGALEPIAAEMGFLGVFAAEGADWRRQRRLMNPSFHAAHVESFHASIATVVERILGEWTENASSGTRVDVLRDLMRFTVDVTSVVAFGRDLDTVRKGSAGVQQHLEVIFPTLGRRVIAPFPYWRLFPFLDRGFDAAIAGVRGLMLELVADARRRLSTSTDQTTHPRTLLESMLLARDDEEAREPLRDDEVYANVVTLLLAGEDTTAITIAWMLYSVATHPEVAARARDEVDSVMKGAVPTIAETKALRYIEAIALESLRLRPPGPQLMLEAKTDVVVGDVAVPAGVVVMVMLRMIQTNPRVFGDAMRFRPERWLDDAPVDTLPHSPRLLLAFGAGPRVCPGRGLALLECSMLVGALLKRFDVQLACAAEAVEEITTFTTQPRGMWLRFVEREPRG